MLARDQSRLLVFGPALWRAAAGRSGHEPVVVAELPDDEAAVSTTVLDWADLGPCRLHRLPELGSAVLRCAPPLLTPSLRPSSGWAALAEQCWPGQQPLPLLLLTRAGDTVHAHGLVRLGAERAVFARLGACGTVDSDDETVDVSGLVAAGLDLDDPAPCRERTPRGASRRAAAVAPPLGPCPVLWIAPRAHRPRRPFPRRQARPMATAVGVPRHRCRAECRRAPAGPDRLPSCSGAAPRPATSRGSLVTSTSSPWPCCSGCCSGFSAQLAWCASAQSAVGVRDDFAHYRDPLTTAADELPLLTSCWRAWRGRQR